MLRSRDEFLQDVLEPPGSSGHFGQAAALGAVDLIAEPTDCTTDCLSASALEARVRERLEVHRYTREYAPPSDDRSCLYFYRQWTGAAYLSERSVQDTRIAPDASLLDLVRICVNREDAQLGQCRYSVAAWASRSLTGAHELRLSDHNRDDLLGELNDHVLPRLLLPEGP